MSWGAVIGGAVTLVGGALSKRSANKGIDKATAASEQAAREATQLQREMWERSEQKSQPFYETGVAANSMLAQLLGIPQGGSAQAPQTQQAPQFGNAGLFNGMTTGGLAQGQQIGGTSRGGIAGMLGHADGDMRVQHNGFGPIMQQAIARGRVPSTGIPNTSYTPQPQAPAQSPTDQRQAMFDLWRSTPGYQFNLDEGRKQYESSAAARGGLLSGKAGKDLLKLGQNYADRTYDDYTNSLRLAAGQGQLVGSQSGQAGMNFANQAGANMINAGNTRASGLWQQGQNNAQFASGVAGLINNGAQNWWQQNQWGGI